VHLLVFYTRVSSPVWDAFLTANATLIFAFARGVMTAVKRILAAGKAILAAVPPNLLDEGILVAGGSAFIFPLAADPGSYQMSLIHLWSPGSWWLNLLLILKDYSLAASSCM
jgi:hypothetical protein